jgi:hypothetical protein
LILLGVIVTVDKQVVQSISPSPFEFFQTVENLVEEQATERAT